MAAQPASTVVGATVEVSTVVVVALVEVATEVAAEATAAESTRSIQLNPAKSKRASWANLTVGPASFRSVYPTLACRLVLFAAGPAK